LGKWRWRWRWRWRALEIRIVFSLVERVGMTSSLILISEMNLMFVSWRRLRKGIPALPLWQRNDG
jgi:hypothetical protein